MCGLADIEAEEILVNMEYHQLVAKQHPSLVVKFSYFEDLDKMYPLKISGVDTGKEIEQVKVGVFVTAVITNKNPFMVSSQPVTFSLSLVEVVTCNNICSWAFLKTIKPSIIDWNIDLISGIL